MFDNKNSDCDQRICGVEFELICSTDMIKSNFPEKWILKFQGKFYGKRSVSHRTFVSFDGGKIWKMLDSRIHKSIILNRGGLIIGTESTHSRIFVSYHEGSEWYKDHNGADNFIYIVPLEFPDNRVVAAINYDRYIVQGDDFENWYIPRYHGNCFQGHQISYLKKKPFDMCFDNRTFILPTMNECTCSIEDFHWYGHFDHSEPKYYYIDNFCISDPLTNQTPQVNVCRDGRKPLNQFNGFTKLDTDICSPRQTISEAHSEDAEYCISDGKYDINQILAFKYLYTLKIHSMKACLITKDTFCQ
ncbi:Sortilin [Thelohanellus kitauei]|uniref:Sortilin n=1 Tax=Thelohanellus kitauei TaxID=669202 RepID=A0A0C2IZN5_THEKT|nr:Sortilin [Thelohanellus kitauei]